MGEVNQKKDRPQRTGLSPFKIDQRRSEVLVRCGGRLVDGILCRFLGVAQGLLALAFDFLNRALALQLVGTDGFADALPIVSLVAPLTLSAVLPVQFLLHSIELHQDKPQIRQKFFFSYGLR